MTTHAPAPCIRAISDLHVSRAENRALVEGLQPRHEDDWLVVAGDVAERIEQVVATLELLSRRFARVVWVPGNHELWSRGDADLRGVERYAALVEQCRSLGVLTPEDPYPVWPGTDGPVTVVPMFLLYDYSFLAPGCSTVAESLAAARAARVVCSDEFMLDPTPFETRSAWCEARVAGTERRLAALAPGTRTLLVNHWPLLREPTRRLRHQAFAQWCGTTRTADWHRRFNAVGVVYGHLHIPVQDRVHGVPFTEVSLGYPREWQRFGLREELAQPVLPGRLCDESGVTPPRGRSGQSAGPDGEHRPLGRS